MQASALQGERVSVLLPIHFRMSLEVCVDATAKSVSEISAVMDALSLASNHDRFPRQPKPPEKLHAAHVLMQLLHAPTGTEIT